MLKSKKIIPTLAFMLCGCCQTLGQDSGKISYQLELHVHNDGTALPCRIHLKNRRGEAQLAPGLPAWRDHFVCDGRVTLSVTAGEYSYEIERGPEYERVSDKVTVDADRLVEISLKRIADLRQSGWFAGDLHVHRPPEDIELLMRAEDLDFAPVITWWNRPWKGDPLPKQLTRQFDGHRIYNVMAGEDEREGGALLFFGLKQPLDLTVDSREYPSPMSFVAEARDQNPNVWIDIEKPFWWDVPTWLASGRMNSIGLANNHMCRDRMYESEAWGRARDIDRLPNPRGNGFWTQEIYYHLLNAGLRLPPSAGSASGVLPNPVGYNRVYVHLDEPFTRDAWFGGLSQGQCFVTNGPLLVATANEQLPGHVFKLRAGKESECQLKIDLTSLDRVKSLELIHNGEVVREIPCSNETQQHLAARLSLDSPGWFLVRVITDRQETFRFASTAPWYVEGQAAQARISRTSCRFFLDWVDERIERVQNNVEETEQLEEVLKWHQQARAFWLAKVRQANVD